MIDLSEYDNEGKKEVFFNEDEEIVSKNEDSISKGEKGIINEAEEIEVNRTNGVVPFLYSEKQLLNVTEYQDLYYLRFNANKCGIRSIFIIGALNDLLDNNYTKLFDSFYEFPPKNINLDELIKNEIYYY